MLALFDAVGRQTGPAAEVEATHQNAGGAERAPKEVHHLFDSAGQPITLEAYLATGDTVIKGPSFSTERVQIYIQS